MKKNCPECNVKLAEVRKAFLPKELRLSERLRSVILQYPKIIAEPSLKKNYYEYRFVCPKCKKEWIYNSLWREFSEVPSTSQFYYSWEKGYLVMRRSWLKKFKKGKKL